MINRVKEKVPIKTLPCYVGFVLSTAIKIQAKAVKSILKFKTQFCIFIISFLNKKKLKSLSQFLSINKYELECQ